MRSLLKYFGVLFILILVSCDRTEESVSEPISNELIISEVRSKTSGLNLTFSEKERVIMEILSKYKDEVTLATKEQIQERDPSQIQHTNAQAKRVEYYFVNFDDGECLWSYFYRDDELLSIDVCCETCTRYN